MKQLPQFTEQIKSLLQLDGEHLSDPYYHYLDLEKTERVDKKVLQERLSVPNYDPFLDVNILLRRCIRLHYPEHLQAGVNELLKAYLLLLNSGNQEPLSKKVWHLLEDMLNYSLATDYPYTARFWNYLSQCSEPVVIYILEQSYLAAGKQTLEVLMHLGQMAVRAGLHTSKLQHILRIVELKCKEDSQTELMALAEEYRQNMEV